MAQLAGAIACVAAVYWLTREGPVAPPTRVFLAIIALAAVTFAMRAYRGLVLGGILTGEPPFSKVYAVGEVASALIPLAILAFLFVHPAVTIPRRELIAATAIIAVTSAVYIIALVSASVFHVEPFFNAILPPNSYLWIATVNGLVAPGAALIFANAGARALGDGARREGYTLALAFAVLPIDRAVSEVASYVSARGQVASLIFPVIAFALVMVIVAIAGVRATEAVTEALKKDSKFLLGGIAVATVVALIAHIWPIRSPPTALNANPIFFSLVASALVTLALPALGAFALHESTADADRGAEMDAARDADAVIPEE